MQNPKVNFAVFIIHRLAEKWGLSTPETYRILRDSDILDQYVLPCYDTLHTLGEQYLVEDISDFVHEKGIAV